VWWSVVWMVVAAPAELPSCPGARALIDHIRTPSPNTDVAATAAPELRAVSPVCQRLVQMWLHAAHADKDAAAPLIDALMLEMPATKPALVEVKKALMAGSATAWWERVPPPPCTACGADLVARAADDDVLAYAATLAPDAITTKLNAAQRVSRAEVLLAAGHASVALDELSSTPSAARAPAEQMMMLRVLARLEKFDDAAALARTMSGPAVLVARAQALAKAGMTNEAVTLYDEAAGADPSAAPGLSFSAAFSLYEARRYDEAHARLRPLRSVASKWQELVFWYIGFIDVLQGRYADAWDGFEALLKAHPQGNESRRARYWQAVAGASIGGMRAAQARTTWKRLHQEEPLDYVGIRSRARLQAPPLQGSVVSRTLPLRPTQTPHISQRWYDLGFDARAFASAPVGTDIDIVATQQAVGDAHRGWRRGPSFLPRPVFRDARLQSSPSWRAAYPSPEAAVIADDDVPPSFVWAIARTESGFLVGAKSQVGARGIVQLMPDTAKAVAKAHGFPSLVIRQLDEPRVSWALGTALLQAHQHEFHSLVLSSAAYNGGVEAARRWRARYADLPPELFIEHIPYRESRDYVKRVLSSEAVYRALDGEPLTLADHLSAALPTMPLPASPPPETTRTDSPL
jgi:tetratricopeptide (TPR) repeat protein